MELGRKCYSLLTEQIALLEARPIGISDQLWREVGRVNVGECLPSCKPGQQCGSDGCGGECGAGCGADETCAQGICVGTGDVRVTVSWETDADLDIYVAAPNGDLIYYANTTGGEGGFLDVDAHAGCQRGQVDEPGVENIFWSVGTAPVGEYTVSVEQWSSCLEPITPYTVTVYRNGITETFQGVYDNSPNRDRREVTTFTVTDEVCTPDCGSAERPFACGSDGCGGSCGTCMQGEQCLSGICAGLGDLSVSLQWETEHDLDLRVIAPNGDEIFWRQTGPTNISGGGQLDVDSHSACDGSTDNDGNATPGVENVFWPSGQAPDGEYIIYVSNWDDCGYVPEILACTANFVCE